MDSKMILIPVLALLLSACTNVNLGQEKYLIGAPLEKITELSKPDGSDTEQVSLFDETTRKIHRFALQDMSYRGSLNVDNPGDKHVVLSHPQGNYLLDLSGRNLTIFNRQGQATKNPIRMIGQPISAAFRPDLNLLVIYDDLNSVGILKLTDNGFVQKAWVGGSLIDKRSILSGDLMADGRLVLALNQQTIAVVDTDQTLSQQKWVFTTFTHSFTEAISWLAPVGDSATQIFVSSNKQLAVIDVNSQSVLQTVTLDGGLEKLSKALDGHVIERLSSNQFQLHFVQNSAIQSRTLNQQGLSVLGSRLSLAQNQWSFVETNSVKSVWSVNNDLDETLTDRNYKSFRISDMLPTQAFKVPDKAQVLMSSRYLFSLFPSELGYATRTDVDSMDVKEAKFFNVGHL